jgi:Rrf2 family protein
MRITSLEEYGLRCALQLAKFKKKSSLVSASQIAELEGLSVEYVSKIMHLFRKAGVVESTRGIQGGFSLAKMPQDFSVKEILDVFAVTQKGNDDLQGFCTNHAGTQSECVHKSQCSIRPVWVHIFDVFDRVLCSITLENLLEGSSALSEKIRSVNFAEQIKEERK